MIKKRGLTLVELLVTIAIMVLLLTVGMAGFRASQKKHELKDNALEVKDIIDRTRRYALAPRNKTDGKRIHGYCIHFAGVTGGMWWIGEYSVDPGTAPDMSKLYSCEWSLSGPERIELGSMPSYINISSAISTHINIGFATARWEGINRTYNGAGQTDGEYSFTVTHTKTGEKKTVSVTKGGITDVQNVQNAP